MKMHTFHVIPSVFKAISVQVKRQELNEKFEKINFRHLPLFQIQKDVSCSK